jgi:hypothetical protein
MASNNSKISELTALVTVATGDKLPIVDISDLTDATTGTTKRITWGELMAAPGAIGGTTPAAGTFTTLTANTGVTMADAANQTWDVAPASDGGFSGDVESVTAGETVALRDVLYQKSADSEWYLADADALATMPVMRMAVGAGTDGNPVNTIVRGVVRYDTWTWTPGQPIYVSTTGTTGNTLTQTAPSGESDVIQIVGYALSATVMYFDPCPITVEIGLDILPQTAEHAVTITVANLTATPQTHMADDAHDQKYTLSATPVAGDVGKMFRIMKTGQSAGTVILDAPDGVTLISAAAQSSAGGTATLATLAYGSMTWLITSATTIQLVEADGTIAFA